MITLFKANVSWSKSKSGVKFSDVFMMFDQDAIVDVLLFADCQGEQRKICI